MENQLPKHMDHMGHPSTPPAEGTNHNMHAMKMYFNVDLPFYFLFGPWYIDTVGKLVGACVGIFLLAVIYEGIRGFRDRLLVRNLSSLRMFQHTNSVMHEEEVDPPASAAVGVHHEDHVVPLVQGTDFSVTPIQLIRWRSYCALDHIIQTCIHGVQLFISYLLMLVFMTYNVYLCVSLLLGACLGYFFFFRRRFVIMGEQECCH